MRLRPLQPDDAETVARWRHDARQHLRTPWPVGLPVTDDRNMWWVAEHWKDFHDARGEVCQMDIVAQAIAGLTGINWPARSAEVSILPNDAAALRTVIDLAFQDIGLHRLEANVAADPIREQFFVENGFRKEGVRRHAHYRNGRWCDVTVLGLITSRADTPRESRGATPHQGPRAQP